VDARGIDALTYKKGDWVSWEGRVGRVSLVFTGDRPVMCEVRLIEDGRYYHPYVRYIAPHAPNDEELAEWMLLELSR
jgi:hypothetical protein